MDLNTLVRVASEISKFGKIRIEIAMRGEPTLHPRWKMYVEILRATNPKAQIMLVTNGTGLKIGDILSFFNNGGNIIMLEAYNKSPYRVYESLLCCCAALCTVKVILYNEQKYSPWTFHSVKERTVLIMPDIKDDKSVTRKFTNQCGAISKKAYDKYNTPRVEEPLQKKCANPFREIAIHYNGDIPICCKDWRGERILWNVHDGDIEKYWRYDESLDRIRHLLYNKFRDFVPCKACNYNGGFYLGFLPKLETLNVKEIRWNLNQLRK